MKVTIKKAVDLMACHKYGDALLEMNCNRCNLRLAVYPQEFVDKDYDTMLTALVEKWNTRRA